MWVAEDMGLIRSTVAPIHRRLPKSGGGPNFRFHLIPRGLHEATRMGWDTPGGWPMVALMCLSWFAFLRAGKVASIRVADGGGGGSGSLPLRGGSLAAHGAGGLSGRRPRGAARGFFTRVWGLDGDDRVVRGGPPVIEAALAGFH